MARKRKPPREMTTDEAMKHLFHPAVVKHAKKEAGNATPQVKATKGESK